MQFEFEVHKFDEVDIDELVSLAFDSKYSTILHTRGISSEKYRRSLENCKLQNNQNAVILARNPSSLKLVGWLQIYTGFPAIYFIRPWHPIIDRIQNEASVASELLTHAVQFTQNAGIHTLEAHFNEMSDELDSLYEILANWYESQGFPKITEEAYMEFNLENFKSITMETQPEYKFVNLSEVSNETLHEPFFESFLNSKDMLFLSQTPEQQEIAFKYWLNRNELFCEQSSFVVLKDDEVVGFCAVRPRKESGEIGPIGIVPNHRKRGLGRLLLTITLNGMIEEGIKTAFLEVSLENTRALKLYKSLGFKQLHSTIYHAWRAL
jgi:ribosomal protein S18 acetylase RimI-like enzyme